MLLVATVISGYTAGSMNLPSRVAALYAEAATGAAGDVAMGRDGTLIKPVSIPTAALPDRRPIRYTIKEGDTLEGIAKTFHVTMREIVWSNPTLRQPLKAGLTIQLPPVPGVVVLVKPGDTAASLASRYGVDATTILGFNDIRSSQLTAGMQLVIPVDPTVGPSLTTGLPADPLDPEELLCPIQGASIVQKFGPTSFALEPPYGGYLHFHSGIDLLAGFGTPIQAAAGGKVTAVGYADYFGLRVQITDAYGLVEIYAHMSNVGANLGQPVQQGQTIGFVGSTGLSIGNHLHLQLEVAGVPTDPGQLIGC